MWWQWCGCIKKHNYSAEKTGTLSLLHETLAIVSGVSCCFTDKEKNKAKQRLWHYYFIYFQMSGPSLRNRHPTSRRILNEHRCHCSASCWWRRDHEPPVGCVRSTSTHAQNWPVQAGSDICRCVSLASRHQQPYWSSPRPSCFCPSCGQNKLPPNTNMDCHVFNTTQKLLATGYITAGSPTLSQNMSHLNGRKLSRNVLSFTKWICQFKKEFTEKVVSFFFFFFGCCCSCFLPV